MWNYVQSFCVWIGIGVAIVIQNGNTLWQKMVGNALSISPPLVLISYTYALTTGPTLRAHFRFSFLFFLLALPSDVIASVCNGYVYSVMRQRRAAFPGVPFPWEAAATTPWNNMLPNSEACYISNSEQKMKNEEKDEDEWHKTFLSGEQRFSIEWKNMAKHKWQSVTERERKQGQLSQSIENHSSDKG